MLEDLAVAAWCIEGTPYCCPHLLGYTHTHPGTLLQLLCTVPQWLSTSSSCISLPETSLCQGKAREGTNQRPEFIEKLPNFLSVVYTVNCPQQYLWIHHSLALFSCLFPDCTSQLIYPQPTPLLPPKKKMCRQIFAASLGPDLKIRLPPQLWAIVPYSHYTHCQFRAPAAFVHPTWAQSFSNANLLLAFPDLDLCIDPYLFLGKSPSAWDLAGGQGCSTICPPCICSLLTQPSFLPVLGSSCTESPALLFSFQAFVRDVPCASFLSLSDPSSPSL